MSDTLPVDVSRERLHDLQVPDEIEVTGDFAIDATNHGESVHLHVHLEDDLADIASVPATNHFLDASDRRTIQVGMAAPAEPRRGKVKIVSAHGACTRYVDVVVTPPEESESTVRVDESLADPAPRASAPSSGMTIDDPRTVATLAAVLALGVGIVVTVLVDTVIVTVGVLVVLAVVLGGIGWTAR